MNWRTSPVLLLLLLLLLIPIPPTLLHLARLLLLHLARLLLLHMSLARSALGSKSF